MTQLVTDLSTDTNEKFFQVTNDLAAMNAVQAEIASNQNRNWAIIPEQFDACEKTFHIRPLCNQMLFSNQQLNFDFDTLSSLLAMIDASIKSYRSALFAYCMNLLNAIPVLSRGHLPMSLIPMDSLMVILESLAIQQMRAADRLSLAIPMTDLLSYYNSQIVYSQMQLRYQ